MKSIYISNRKIKLPGLRNIKTALAVLTLFVLYQITGLGDASTAITASILCLQNSVSKTMSESKYRVISTIFGGIYGIVFVYLFLGINIYIYYICLSLSIVAIIYICNLAKQYDVILNTLFVFIAVATVPQDEVLPMAYALKRIFDTLVGILVTVFINRYFFPPREQRLNYKRTLTDIEQLRKDSNFIKQEKYKKSTWAGGEALELYIHPKNSLYEEYNFKYRISIADTKGDLELSLTPNYYRRTMILNGETTFSHEGYHTIKLKSFDQDYFKGNVKTVSKGVTTNFNIMLAKGYESDIYAIQNNENFDFVTITNDQLDVYNFALYYSLYDGTVFTLTKGGIVVYTRIINEGDSLVFKHLNRYALDEYTATISNRNVLNSEDVVCVRSNIRNKRQVDKLA